ncbi:hypothetical protein A2Z53_02155 [Candidatus Giovannonibacteria bacterium RIFCSPHIGHO2_02_42_15]|uniref:Uncharacterized protein n=2 Tax=Candidatus Giovannoniibacteriota TaxID=1752738 RepID=A0A1F5VKJ7_9BACT|nr:MAG: hypothetical protein UV11_C0002G0024 [Candidatus Giovannonibacteria bacterium GW2011_GWF2_42_19]OGF63738.1 MAG: hypothetical protein A2Z53_02155 [Candidatus Giovannonibacteria bacterium RIFCSPHIGHO2_02_42_15]
MKEIGAHKRAEILDDKDINGRYMAMCRDCETCAHAYELTEAETNLSLTPCIIDCANCNKIRHSHDGSPAVPLGGSCNTLLHICPNDGRKWWQMNTHFHLWQHVTSEREWQALRRERTQPSYEFDEW